MFVLLYVSGLEQSKEQIYANSANLWYFYIYMGNIYIYIGNTWQTGKMELDVLVYYF